MKLETKHRLERADLVTMFAPTLGQEKSTETVDAAVKGAGLLIGPYTFEQAITILGHMGKTTGVVGLVSRLAIARLRAAMAFHEAQVLPRTHPPPN
jgi:hypothetical protein